jgi:hypothetical protein
MGSELPFHYAKKKKRGLGKDSTAMQNGAWNAWMDGLGSAVIGS